MGDQFTPTLYLNRLPLRLANHHDRRHFHPRITSGESQSFTELDLFHSILWEAHDRKQRWEKREKKLRRGIFQVSSRTRSGGEMMHIGRHSSGTGWQIWAGGDS